MITNVTNVLVGSAKGLLTEMPAASTSKTAFAAHVGKFIAISGSDENPNVGKTVKLGIVTDKVMALMQNGVQKFMPVIKWAHIINNNAVKKIAYSAYKADTKDTAVITFNQANGNDLKRILLRVTYKDVETRYRKWTETYEVVVAPNATAAQIAQAFGETLLKNNKRNRFEFEVSGNTLTLTAKDYTDDDAVDTLNVAKTIRFDVHMYYTLPNATGFAYKNKYAYTDATIVKTDGEQYTASAKLVRDREAWAMGYEGILNRGEGTWPIIKPAMTVDLNAQYNALTIEFNNQYRAADDIVRYTRNVVELYDTTETHLKTIANMFAAAAVEDHQNVIVDGIDADAQA